MRADLLRWYRKHKRDLPWRRTKDPYAIWVSEAMLQQTTVAAVIPYWEKFLKRFPNLESLAHASEEEVLAQWTGLGYYRRARALREGAIAVMERHSGRLPSEREDLLALPGIGPYTAGAIASVAFGRAEPIVDGNVKRVFARLFAIKGEGAPIERRYWKIAKELVEGPDPGDLNQAVMELGATICTPRSPDCAHCPLAKSCKARARGNPEAFPSSRPRPTTTTIDVTLAWIERAGRVLLERKHHTSPLRGSWDLPLASEFRQRTGLRLTPRTSIAKVNHTILTRKLEIDVVWAKVAGAIPRNGALRWIDPARIGDVATSAATTKTIRAVYSARLETAHA